LHPGDAAHRIGRYILARNMARVMIQRMKQTLILSVFTGGLIYLVHIT